MMSAITGSIMVQSLKQSVSVLCAWSNANRAWSPYAGKQAVNSSYKSYRFKSRQRRKQKSVQQGKTNPKRWKLNPKGQSQNLNLKPRGKMKMNTVTLDGRHTEHNKTMEETREQAFKCI